MQRLCDGDILAELPGTPREAKEKVLLFCAIRLSQIKSSQQLEMKGGVVDPRKHTCLLPERCFND
jgi:hypothetical protein